MIRVCRTFLSVHCSLVVTCLERANLLALLCLRFYNNVVFCHFRTILSSRCFQSIIVFGKIWFFSNSDLHCTGIIGRLSEYDIIGNTFFKLLRFNLVFTTD